MRIEISDEERAFLDDWLKKHEGVCTLRKTPLGRMGGSFGERLAYEVMPTAMGMHSTMSCLCGAKVSYLEDDGKVIMEIPQGEKGDDDAASG